MQVRSFGRHGFDVSALGFGCMRLPTWQGDQINELLATQMLREAIDAGVNYVDTAYPYHNGQSEPFVGRALKDGYRQKVKLATKMPTWLTKTTADFDKYLDEQLDRLQTDHIDLYLLHALHRTRWEEIRALKVLEWGEKAKASGKIGLLGFSFHDTYPVFETIINDFDGWDFCQIQYNYVDIDEQAGMKGLKLAAGRGIPVVIMEPLLGGKLAVPPESVKKVFDAAPVQRTAADWALQWLWDQPEVTLVLSGMSDPQQVKENLASANGSGVGSLNEADQKVIAEAYHAFRSTCPIPCTKCAYCKPCPQGVDIPRNFEYFNEGTMDLWGQARFRYSQIPKDEQALACIGCRECESKCPQNIAISEWMPYVHEVMALEKPYDGRRKP